MKKLTKGPILLVEENKSKLQDYIRLFEEEKFLVTSFSSCENAIKQIDNGLAYRLAVVSLSLKKPHRGLEVIRASKERHKSTPIISISNCDYRTVMSYFYDSNFNHNNLIDLANKIYFPIKI